jgi:hypothetical protein
MARSTSEGRNPADTDASRGGPEPTFAQRKILDLYVDLPNAAAVSRQSDQSERNVRRIVEKFGDYVEDKWQAREAEHLRRDSARTSKVEGWLDESLDDLLRRLDALAGSANEGVALRAIKMKLDMLSSLRADGARRRDVQLDPMNMLNDDLFETLPDGRESR